MDKTYTKNQQLRPLFDALVQYSNSNVVPFDVPGHKMGIGIHKDFKDVVGEQIFKMDINSMKEMDNLSNPEGIIKEAEDLAADLFQSDNAFFLVNGSTSGVQNMILASVSEGDKIIIPRNIHKSAINALVLSGATPVYIYPEINHEIGISYVSSIKETIRVINENPDAKAILLLNPTYYGFANDLKQIIDYAHKMGLIVLVDESHGTHFYLHSEFPTPSMSIGADLATISVHKTGGSLTQSSILLHNNGRISVNKVRSVINLSQSSSASYLLLSSLDMARYNLATNKSLIENVLELSKYARISIDRIKGINVVHTISNPNSESHYHDISKLLLDIKHLGKTGFELYDILKKEYNIQIEFGETFCILAIISVGDTKDSINSLITALQDLSDRFYQETLQESVQNNLLPSEIKMTPRQAFFNETQYIDIEQSVGKISGDQIMIYPPGIPLLLPGEVVTQNIITEYKRLLQYGTKTVGSIKSNTIKIKVVKEELS